MTTPQLYACLRYQDADAAIAFLTALGFTERLVVRDEDDPATVQHAQFAWRDHGGIMFGSIRDDDKAGLLNNPGTAIVNLVVESDDAVDDTVQRAVAAGGTLVTEPQHPPYGGRTAMVRDAEGNCWNVDSYPGEEAPG